MRKNISVRRAFCPLFAAFAAVAALWASPAAAPKRSAAPRSSPAYRVTVLFELTSPLVADGRASVAELAFRVIFSPVVFEFDPEGDPLLGRCQVETGAVRGTFSKFVLNDVQKGGVRQTPAFLTPRPPDFRAGIGIESEPMEEKESAPASRVPPAKVRLSFWTDFGAGQIKWGTPLATGVLENIRVVFEAPFRDLMAGKPRTITLPCEGKYPEDRGTWKIEFMPGLKKNR